MQARDYRAALAYAQEAIRLDSKMWIGHVQLAQACEQLGEYNVALEAFADAARLSGGNSKTIAMRGYIIANTHRIAEAQAILKLLDATARDCRRQPSP